MGRSRAEAVGAEAAPAAPVNWRGGAKLLSWFARHRRDLPWRHTRDPYAIWVSEIMLQQTQVATVVPYYTRFLQAFPALADLAAADEQSVLRLWEGLGYYRRARHLHQAARDIMAAHQGQFPTDPTVLQKLPGMGRYTANAVLSQAFDQRLPILEANTLRLLSRLFARRQDPRSPAGRRWLWQAAEVLLPRRRVGEFNQALMEVGALVCTPAAPDCAACPLASFCQARQLGLQEQIPPRPTPQQPVEVREVAVVVRRGSQVLLVQRPDQGRWAAMWEFPHGTLESGETHEQAARRLLPQLTGLQATLKGELLTVRHGVTRFHITLVCLEARHRKGAFRSAFYRQGLWLEPGQLASYPVSSPQRRLAQSLADDVRQRQLF